MACAEWTPTAEDKLTEIAYWIAVEDERPLTARKIVEEIQHKAEVYAATPGIGQRHPDLPEGWFYFRHKRGIVLYQPRDDGIDVLRVVDAARDFPRLFP
jgi:plasmid stabilization system protein ParE